MHGESTAFPQSIVDKSLNFSVKDGKLEDGLVDDDDLATFHQSTLENVHHLQQFLNSMKGIS